MLSRREFLLSGAAGIGFVPSAQAQNNKARATATVTRTSGRLSLGLTGPTYYSGFCPFLNWQKVASAVLITRKVGGDLSGRSVFDAGIYLDPETGELVSPAPDDLLTISSLFYASPGEGNVAGGYDFSGMEWTIKWDGAARCTINGLTKGGTQAINNDARSGTFKFGVSPGNTWATFTITNPKDPPRNIRICQTRYAANIAAGETFNPDWLAQIRAFGILRFMDWMGTNNSALRDFSQIANASYFRWGADLSATSSFGSKGGMPLSVICELANRTRCHIHVNIPHLSTDAFVRSFAQFFRDNLDPALVVTFEYSNECWNFGFMQTRFCLDQGTSIWGRTDGARYTKWYGYHSAQCMKTVRDVFSNRSRWRGCLGTQTVNPAVTVAALTGVNYYRANVLSPANSLAVSDLFDEIGITGYFGDVQGSTPINNITNANPAVVTSPGHRYANGQRLKLFVAAGMIELNNTFVTIANVTTNTYELSGVNTTSYKASVPDNRNYAHPAIVFDLMNRSSDKFAADKARYPTKYTYFNDVVAESCLKGESDGFVTEVSVARLRQVHWPAQKAIADANHLDLTQYEGGLHFVGSSYLAGYGGQPQFNEYLYSLGHSAQIAAVYTAMYDAFFGIGGRYPSKFVEGGQTSRYGTWAGMRFIPGDEGNPVWRAVRRANDGS
jgi:hypothetical protein